VCVGMGNAIGARVQTNMHAHINLAHTLRPHVTPSNTNSPRPNPHTQTPTTHFTRSKDLTVQQSIDTLRDATRNISINLDTMRGESRASYTNIRATCDRLGDRCQDLRTSFQTLQREVTEYNDDDFSLGAEQQQNNKLSDIKSLALTTNMATSVLNSIQIFDRYDSHDPKLWFIKLEAYFRARKMGQDTWLAAIIGFLSDTVLYAIDDIPDIERNSYIKLKTKNYRTL
jgi:hypothetical protein